MWWDTLRNNQDERHQVNATHTPRRRESFRFGLARERGQSLVEFAVILPLLLLIVLGTVDLGMGFKTYIALTNAAREGARWISIHPSDQAGAKARIASEAITVGLQDGLLVADGYGVSFSPNQNNYAAGDKVTVNVEYEYELLFGAITGLPAIPFTASSTMVVLYDE
jgi:Flp pilus assembly protein TadG